ncbi:hypothetical protein [Streptomyces sp. NBC_01431]|uniref:hypothetical protein n=1 Tax=Streptomyces sp. NBC_01431 TaxID=2903863 RepID=UPI002E2FEEA4|nr:hypothetical protein [Streptomyces sp. NBC_01431]
MSAGSVARRSWGSFIGGRPHVPRAGGRARDGYTVRQRFWASFTGLDLPWARVGSVSAPEAPVRPPAPSARPAASSDAIAGRLEPGWFALPPILTVAGLTAAGGDAVILETSSPDGGARFLLRTQGAGRPEYWLELVLRGVDAARPLVSPVRYTTAGGGEKVLLVPVVRGRLGPPASLVRLPGFAADSSSGGWTARAPAPVTPDTDWDAATVADSVRAALNEATRDAWRQVREIVGDDLRATIDGELS